jgi:hypothetical protein
MARQLLSAADGVVPEPLSIKDLFPKRVGFGTTPLRLNKEVVSICLVPQLPLLTQEGTP